jgi:hypothetical protein
MYTQNCCCQTTSEMRGLPLYQEACFEMKTNASLNSDQGQLLTLQTGQLLVAIGSLLANQPIVNAHVSNHTSRNLTKIGRKLLAAGKCTCNS